MGSLVDVGIFKDTLAPSFALHSSFSLAAWAVGRYTNRVDAKDWVWPEALVCNAWWAAVGRRVFYEGSTFTGALRALSRPERLILTGVTLWGGRLFAHTAARSLKRGTDNPRYEDLKKEPSDWNRVLLSLFLGEAAWMTVISLPFTAPFYHQGAAIQGYSQAIQLASIGIFGAGLAIEALADYQLVQHNAAGKSDTLLRDGVWSIVRHPNYLGDVLVHASFALLLFGSDMLAPIELLGPVANYLYLRYVGGDKDQESRSIRRYSVVAPGKEGALHQWREEKNSVWPSVAEIRNKWAWTVLGCGAAAVAVEFAIDSFFSN